MVSTDYVTKSVEKVYLPGATKEAIINFFFGLFLWYCLPQEVRTDGGGKFVGHKIIDTLRNHHITYRVTSPYH